MLIAVIIFFKRPNEAIKGLNPTFFSLSCYHFIQHHMAIGLLYCDLLKFGLAMQLLIGNYSCARVQFLA